MPPPAAETWRVWRPAPDLEQCRAPAAWTGRRRALGLVSLMSLAGLLLRVQSDRQLPAGLAPSVPRGQKAVSGATEERLRCTGSGACRGAVCTQQSAFAAIMELGKDDLSVIAPPAILIVPTNEVDSRRVSAIGYAR